MQGEIPETVREHYRTLAHHASECIGCGLCEPRCPFGVEIVEAMRRAAERFRILKRQTMKRNTTFLTDDQRLQLIDLLHVEACSCVIRNGDVTRIFRERGVKDLYRLLEEEPELLDGAFVADKVMGNGAAALMILGGVGELHADVISRPARLLLAASPVHVSYTLEVPYIVNRITNGAMPRGDALPRLRHGRRSAAADPQLYRRTKMKAFFPPYTDSRAAVRSPGRRRRRVARQRAAARPLPDRGGRRHGHAQRKPTSASFR